MSTYRSSRRDAAVADNHIAGHGECMGCGVTAPRDDLVDLGGKCRSCYGRYCADANPGWYRGQRFSTDERKAMAAKMRDVLRGMVEGQPDPRSWAKALRQREQSGETLSIAKRSAWRAALMERTTFEAGPDELARIADELAEHSRKVREYADERGLAL